MRVSVRCVSWGGRAAEGEDRWVAAEQFVHSGGEPHLAVAQAVVRLGVLGQEVQAAGGRAAYRVVARDHQQEEEHLQLRRGQFGVGGESRDHVVGGVFALVGSQDVRVVEHVAQ